MTCIITKLTKLIKEKYLQIASFISKVETQAQSTIELSQGLIYPPKIASLGDTLHLSKLVQIER